MTDRYCPKEGKVRKTSKITKQELGITIDEFTCKTCNHIDVVKRPPKKKESTETEKVKLNPNSEKTLDEVNAVSRTDDTTEIPVDKQKEEDKNV